MTKKRDRIEQLYAALSKAETRPEVGRLIAELRAEGIRIPDPRPINGASGEKSAEAERKASWLLRNVHRRCAAIPYGESSWVYGYVHGVAYDPKDGVCLYTIHLDDTRRIVKRDGAEGLRFLDGHKNYWTEKELERTEMAEERVEADRRSMEDMKSYIGYMVEFPKLGPVRIVSVAKSMGKVMYRVRTKDGDHLYRYPKPGMSYWRDEETDSFVEKSRNRTKGVTVKSLQKMMEDERAMAEKADRIAEEYKSKADAHRRNIEALKAEMAKKYED